MRTVSFAKRTLFSGDNHTKSENNPSETPTTKQQYNTTLFYYTSHTTNADFQVGHR